MSEGFLPSACIAVKVSLRAVPVSMILGWLVDFYKIQEGAGLCHSLVPVIQANTTGPRVTSSPALKYHRDHSSLVPLRSGKWASAVRVVVLTQATCHPGRRSQTKGSLRGTSANLAGVAIKGLIGVGLTCANHAPDPGTVPPKRSVQKVAHQSPIALRSLLSYRKSEERWGNRVDDNTSPPILLCDNISTPPLPHVPVAKLSTLPLTLPPSVLDWR